MYNNGWIKGTWEIPGNANGNFELHADIPRWSGYYMQGPERHDMLLQLSIGNFGVFGNGYDSVGAFSISGTYNSYNGHTEFTKYYYGEHSVQYRGQHHKEGGCDVINGQWCIPGNSWDNFELRKC